MNTKRPDWIVFWFLLGLTVQFGCCIYAIQSHSHSRLTHDEPAVTRRDLATRPNQ